MGTETQDATAVQAMASLAKWAGGPGVRSVGIVPQASRADKQAVIDRIRAALPELLTADRWLCWRSIPNPDPTKKPKKVPINPHNGAWGSSTDSATWGTFTEAAGWYLGHDEQGPGFALGDGFGGVDMDDCVDDGNVSPDAWRIIESFNSYTEFSPSGTGVHILLRGTDRSFQNKNMKGMSQLEVYSHGRYFTVTGKTLVPGSVAKAQDSLDALWMAYAPAYKRAKSNGVHPTPATWGSPDMALVDDALRHIHPWGIPYGEWVAVLMGIHAEFGAGGLPMAEAWGQGADGEIAGKWSGFKPSGNGSGRVGLGTVFALAKQHGWQRPQAERPAGYQAPADVAPWPETLEEPADYGADVPVVPSTSAQPATSGRRVRWTAGELLTAELPPPPWLIPGMIPIGLVILAGRRKLGKSFLALQMAGAIGSGGNFLGQKIAQGRCLYLALEDTAARLQGRMKMQAWRQDAQVDFALTWPALDDGGLVNLQDELTAGAYNLLVIDTLSRCLTRRQNQNDVTDMTFALSALQQLAFSRSMTILLIDHHTKGSQALDLADPVDDLLGSSGKGAVADAVFGLYRPRGQREVKLLGRGRDFDELSFDLRFDGVTGCWQHDAPTLTFPQQAIIDALQRAGAMTAAKIARATEQDRSNSFTRLQELVARNLITFDVTSKEYDVL